MPNVEIFNHVDKEQFSLCGQPFIELNKLIKILAWCTSGGEAKTLIADGYVKVDGEVEMRKRFKIRQGQVVEFMADSVVITE